MREPLDNLRVLRGVACLTVVAAHAGAMEASLGLGFNPLGPFHRAGYLSVDLFFVLSGFLITLGCRQDIGRPGRLPGFLFRRAWRVYPLYWLVLALASVVYWGLNPKLRFGPDAAAEWVAYGLLLPPAPRSLPVAWTLPYEVLFYLAFAALIVLPRRAAVPLLAGWAVAVAGCVGWGHSPENRFARHLLSPHMLEIVAGCLLAWSPVRLTGGRAAGLAAAGGLWLLAGLVATYHPDPIRLPENTPVRVLVFGPPAALWVFALAGWERVGGRLGWRRLAAVGDASFSVYLTHLTVQTVLFYVTLQAGMSHTRLPHLAWVALMLGAGLLPGLVLYRYVEAPLVRFGKRFGRREGSRPAGAVPNAPPSAAPEPTRRAA